MSGRFIVGLGSWIEIVFMVQNANWTNFNGKERLIGLVEVGLSQY